MSRLKKYRKAVSPVVTTLFLFGVIIGAISVTLAVIYPQIQSLNDQIKLETAGSSMQSLDASIQSLILNGEDSSFSTEIKMGTSGLFQYNNGIQAYVELYENGLITPKLSYLLYHPRLQLIQPVDTEFLGEGESQYFGAAGDQTLIYLNSTTRRLLSWSIINQSRDLGSEEVATSLSYRNIVTTEFDVIPSKLQYNATVQLQIVNMTLAQGSSTSKSGAKAGIEINYKQTINSITDWVRFNDDATLRVTIQFPDVGSSNQIEIPLSLEAPAEVTTVFSIRFEFVFHQVEVNIL